MSYNFVTVQGKYESSTGVAASGRVRWFPTAPIVDSSLHVTLAEPIDLIELDSTGTFSVSLLATDNPNLSVFGWAFQPMIEGVPVAIQYVKVLFASGATQFIDQLPSFP